MQVYQQKDDECLVYLIRHGQTVNNYDKVLQGSRSDPPLTLAGRIQAQTLAESMPSVARVYSSPMRRAAETAHQLATIVTVVTTLIEVDVGEWGGKSWAQVEAEYPKEYADFTRSPAYVKCPGGESMEMVSWRVLPMFRAICLENLGRRIAVVAHKGVNRVILADGLGINLNYTRNIEQHNCCVNRILFKPGGQLQVLTVNEVQHLEGP